MMLFKYCMTNLFGVFAVQLNFMHIVHEFRRSSMYYVCILMNLLSEINVRIYAADARRIEC